MWKLKTLTLIIKNIISVKNIYLCYSSWKICRQIIWNTFLVYDNKVKNISIQYYFETNIKYQYYNPI